jgi:hypothetical protein
MRPYPYSETGLPVQLPSPLEQAIIAGQLEETQTLLLDKTLDLHAFVKDPGALGGNYLHLAAVHDQSAIVPILVKYGVKLEEQRGPGSETPLHMAARLGKVKAICALVKSGAMLHARDDYARTPLHVAILAQQWDAARQLIKLGARIDIRDAQDKGPLDDVYTQSIRLELSQLHSSKKPFQGVRAPFVRLFDWSMGNTKPAIPSAQNPPISSGPLLGRTTVV